MDRDSKEQLLTKLEKAAVYAKQVCPSKCRLMKSILLCLGNPMDTENLAA